MYGDYLIYLIETLNANGDLVSYLDNFNYEQLCNLYSAIRDLLSKYKR